MLPKAHLTSYSRISSSEWVTPPSWLSGSLRPFLYSSSVYSCYCFLISPVSVLYHADPSIKYFLDTSSFFEETSVFSIQLFSSISLHCSFKMAFLSLLALLWNSVFSCIYLFLSPLPFAFLISSIICKASLDNYFTFLYFFSFETALFTTSCKMLWTSVHSSSGSLPAKSNTCNLFVTSTV